MTDSPGGPPTTDADALEQELLARERRLLVYLRVRGIIGLVVGAFGATVAIGALLIAAVAVGLLDVPLIAVWTQGAGAFLAPFLPGALAWLLLRTGAMWWRGRHPEVSDVGCACA